MLVRYWVGIIQQEDGSDPPTYAPADANGNPVGIDNKDLRLHAFDVATGVALFVQRVRDTRRPVGWVEIGRPEYMTQFTALQGRRPGVKEM